MRQRVWAAEPHRSSCNAAARSTGAVVRPLRHGYMRNYYLCQVDYVFIAFG